ncbi:MAG: hypothetical protein LBJ38_01490 [Oscillospiraceae bacterium]|nr:hypothetical protein [Oscillospiraceae bacterium]
MLNLKGGCNGGKDISGSAATMEEISCLSLWFGKPLREDDCNKRGMNIVKFAGGKMACGKIIVAKQGVNLLLLRF